MAAKSTKTKFVTGKVRFSYANVFQPAETPSGTLKYSVSILIPKSDTETITRFKKAFEECKSREMPSMCECADMRMCG